MTNSDAPFYSAVASLTSRSAAPAGALKLAAMWKVPPTLTPLIGREQEVASICSLLTRHEIRLLTLAGAGGVGKTRLGCRVAEALRKHFTGGVCFVHLAAVSDPELLVPTIAQGLGIQEIGGQHIFEQVKVVLRKKFLLLLDNFEQVVMAAPLIEDLLEACPDLKIVTTSREVLHVRGEQEFFVSPLSLPDLTGTFEIVAVSQSTAVALFVHRAQSAQPTFQLTPQNMHAIAEICIRLDGLPLAIELAAERVKLLSPHALLDGLSQGYQLLQALDAEPRTSSSLTRHHTLRNALQWSYSLLNAPERRLFCRLAVFAGDWTLEAAEAVYRIDHAADGASSLGVSDSVASLLDKSLLLESRQEERKDGGEEPRFLMLKLVREYALEVLQESREVEETWRAYALYYLQLAQEAEPHLKDGQQARWLARLEREQENLRAVLGWLIERKEAELAQRLCAALWWFWRLRGYWTEARRWLDAALGLTGAVEVTPAFARALCAAGDLASCQDDYPVARSYIEKAIALCRALDMRRELIYALCASGVLLYMQGDAVASHQRLQESEELCRQFDEPWLLAYVLRQSGLVAWYQRNIGRAAASTREALDLVRPLGDTSLLSTALLSLAGIALVQEDLAQAAELAREGLTTARKLGDKSLLANTLQNLGYIASLQGSLTEAEEQAQQALLLFHELGDERSITIALHSLGYIASLQHDFIRANACFVEALFLSQENEDENLMGWHLAALATVAASEGQPIRAARLFGAAEQRLDVRLMMNDAERAQYDRAVQLAREQLGEKAFAAARAEGESITLASLLSSPEPVQDQEKAAGLHS